MNNQQAIDRLVKHLEWGWTEETVAAIEMGIHALKETQWIPISERLPEDEATYWYHLKTPQCQISQGTKKMAGVVHSIREMMKNHIQVTEYL